MHLLLIEKGRDNILKVERHDKQNKVDTLHINVQAGVEVDQLKEFLERYRLTGKSS